MVRKIIALIMICALALAGCSAQQPQASANMPDINPKAEAANKDTLDVALYFGYRGESLLAAETRTIDVPVSATLEEAVVKALIAGPSAGQNELSGLFWEGVTLAVDSISSNGNVLFVTLSDEFVSTQPKQDELVLESGSVANQKMLAIESIVNTIAEMGNYSLVQIQVERGTDMSERITQAEAGMNETSTSPLEPLGRDERLLLTPRNTMEQALDAFSKKDWTRLYNFTAYTSPDGTQKPDGDAFSKTLDEPGNALESYSVVSFNVSNDGQTAVVWLNCTIKTREGDTLPNDNFPMVLVRESYIWKVSYISILDNLVNVE